MRRVDSLVAILAVAVAIAISPAPLLAQTAGPAAWQNDLTPIGAKDWNRDFAAHLLERAGFGGTPAEIDALAKMTPAQAIARLVRYEGTDVSHLPAFDESGIRDPGLEPFPPSRPAVTDLAKKNGEALGIKVKPSGNRPLQPIVDEFFYWLRASVLETNRVAYWWANRMLTSPRPLQEKMALFWHGHYATNEPKVRDYRKLLAELQLYENHGTGNFRDLMVSMAEDPGMLTFLDAGVNVKGAPNENFAREIMEMFTMGVGHYTEKDVREAARAFTGWNYVDLKFVVNKDKHDDGEKTFLGKTGNFDGVDIIDIIMQQPATADYIAGKLYRFFVRENLSPELQKKLGAVLRDIRITKSLRCSKPCSCRAISTAPLPWARTSRARSSWPYPLIRSSASKTFPASRISTLPPPLSASASSRRLQLQDGPEAGAGSLPACCSSAAISPATCSSPISTSLRPIASPPAKRCAT